MDLNAVFLSTSGRGGFVMGNMSKVRVTGVTC